MSKELLRLIKSRRSIRKYKPKMPPKKVIQKILEAGRWAPSGLNNQPWRFMIIKESFLKEGLANFTDYGKIIKEAPLVIAVFLDKQSSYHYEKDIMAIGACIQNMLLCAHSLGLGACWLGQILNRKKEVEEFLGLGKRFAFMSLISLGYPEEKLKPTPRKRIQELILKYDS